MSLVNRLIVQGLVGHEPAQEGRRQVYITLTPLGGDMLEQLAIVHREELRRIKPQLNSLLDRLTGAEETALSVSTYPTADSPE